MRNVTVMVVEDSAVARELIVDTLHSDPRITVIAAVDNGEDAVRLAPRLSPDVISMDVRLPGMSGIEATRRIMEIWPTPVIVVASDISRSSTANAMEAMRAGALLVVEKPRTPEAYQAMTRRLTDQFVSLSSLKLVRQRFNALPAYANSDDPAAGPTAPIEVVGIVASTGGPPAIAQILEGLGKDISVPVLVVQHMGAGFLEGYAEWLATTTGLDVRLARNGEIAARGRVYVAPGGSHLTYRSGHLRLQRAPGDNGHVPSGDELFSSLASSGGERALGVILTGMGDDGAHGLAALRRCGGLTIGQDQATSAVYGMPAAAKVIGAVGEELPLAMIAPRVLQLLAASENARQRKRAAL